MNVVVVCYCLLFVGWCRLENVDCCCAKCVVGFCGVVLLAVVRCGMCSVLWLCVARCCWLM